MKRKKKKNKKILIIILCLIVILLITSLILFNKTAKENKITPTNNNNNMYIPTNKSNIKDIIKENSNNKTEITTNTTTPENNNPKEGNISEKKDDNTNSNNNNNTGLKPADHPPTTTYTCPDGYTLNGTKCTSTIEADHVCPDNTHDYAYTNIPNGQYCINLSEGYDNDNDECPDGYGPLVLSGLGVNDTYQCFPLHEKIYVCPDDYTKNDTKCTKTIDATIK